MQLAREGDYNCLEETFILAVHGGKYSTVELLLEKGADVDTQDEYDRTALTMALDRGHSDIARLLERYQ